MKIIGLTGGIASGKSLIAQCFVKRGLSVIDADIISREVVMQGMPAHNKLTEQFGDGFFNDNGELDRRKLREHVFANSSALDKLNGIMHPAIVHRIKEILQGLTHHSHVVLVAPLLFETGMDDICDRIWLVVCDEQTRINRLIDRDRISEATARAMISSQMPDCERAMKSDIIIDNSGSVADTIAQVEQQISKEIDLDRL